jgi:hypothetical protein
MQTITELTLEAIFDMYNNFFGSDFDNMNEFGRPVEQQDLHLDEVRFSYDSVIRLQDQVGVNCIGFRNYVGENKVFFWRILVANGLCPARNRFHVSVRFF